jgi:hypothetical protein
VMTRESRIMKVLLGEGGRGRASAAR